MTTEIDYRLDEETKKGAGYIELVLSRRLDQHTATVGELKQALCDVAEFFGIHIFPEFLAEKKPISSEEVFDMRQPTPMSVLNQTTLNGHVCDCGCGG